MLEPGTVIEGNTIRFQQLLPGPIETVWEFLTNPSMLPLWLADGRIECRDAGWVDLHFNVEELPERKDGGAHIVGIVSECTPPAVLSYSWNDADHPDSKSFVRFELTKAQDKVKIVVTHEGLPPEAIAACSAGWHAHISMLESALKGEEPRRFAELYKDLQARYEQENTMPPKS